MPVLVLGSNGGACTEEQNCSLCVWHATEGLVSALQFPSPAATSPTLRFLTMAHLLMFSLPSNSVTLENFGGV